MEIVVCVKHVPDTTELRVDPDTGAPMLQYAPTRINDYDRHALEEAARLREQRGAGVTVLCGDLSEDGYYGLVPGLLAARLGLPFVSGATRLEVGDDSATVTRVAGDVEETYRLRLPAVASVSRLINTPRLVTTLQVVRVPASRVTIASAGDVGVDEASLAPERLASRIVGMRSAATPRRRELLTGDPDSAVARLVASLAEMGVLR